LLIISIKEYHVAATNRSLFSWDDVENLPDLKRLSLVLNYIPDEKIVRAMEKRNAVTEETTSLYAQYDPSKPVTRSLFPYSVDSIVYTEKGTIHCVCPKTGIQRDLAFQGLYCQRHHWPGLGV